MTAASDYLENKILDHVFGDTDYTSPTCYLALFTATPNDAGGGTEVSGNGYARQVMSFAAASGGDISTDADITYSASGGNFGTVSHWGVFDAATGGNLLTYGAFDSSTAVNDGESYTVSSGDLTISQA